MAGRRATMSDVREIVRRGKMGQSVRGIARDMGVARKTVEAYLRLAQEKGWLEGDTLPTEAEMAMAVQALAERARPTVPSLVEPYRGQIEAWRTAGVSLAAMVERLTREHGYRGSYSSLYRFVKGQEARSPEAFVRIETAPGEEAQVDFGYAGRLWDSRERRERKAWMFVMTLSFSRHMYVEMVFDQTVATFVGCHGRAFRFVGGVPRRIRIDNLKAAVIEAALYDPLLNRLYRHCAEHYGFLITPCPPRTPEQKGKVERMIAYVRGHLIRGRTYRDIHEANEKALSWVLEVASRRCHQTTRRVPLELYDAQEKAALAPLPATDWEPCDYKQVKLHPDCHVVYAGSYYSAPFRLIGQSLILKATAHSVELYHDHTLVAVHPRASRPGTRSTQMGHYPPEKAQAVMATPLWCRQKARRVGPATTEVIEHLLAERPLDRLRAVQAILAQEKRYGRQALEQACRRALYFGALEARSIKRILQQGLHTQPLPHLTDNSSSHQAAAPRLFARSAAEFFPSPPTTERRPL